MYQMTEGKDHSAPQNVDPKSVAHVRNFHQAAAMHAARMIRLQYTREAKGDFRRECLGHLKASLDGSKRA
jgi:hypothetical protein